MKKLLLVVSTFTLAVFAWSNEREESEVKLPLSKYLELVEKQKTQPITVIEETLLKGDYKNSNFQISFKGQAVSPWKKQSVLDSFDGHLRDCNGSGIISFEEGVYNLLPQKSSFQITCKLQPKKKNLKLLVLNALFFESQVAHAESNMNEDNPSRRTLTLLEKSKDTLQKPRADIAAKAHYKLTVLPDTSKFDYHFVINNPNRLSEKFALNLANNEVIESISTDLKYLEAGSVLNFSVPTGAHNVYVKGKLNGQNFKPLLKSEEQYLLIQNHPLMQVQATTPWRRIATQESSISQDYNSARAFLIDPRESLSWSSKKLEVFSALGYTLKNANYLYYMPRNGQAVVEATYQIANQGTPEIALAIPGKALYVSVDGIPSPLYKDEKGQLLLSMTSGDHRVLVQYQPQMPERFLASFSHENLVKPNAVISQSSLTLRHDHAWSLIAGRFGQDFVSKLNLKDLLYAFIFAALLFFMLKKFYGLHNNKLLYSLAVPVGLLTLFGSLYTFTICFLLVALTLWRYRNWLFEQFKRATQFQFNYKKAAFVLIAFFVASYFLRAIINVPLARLNTVDSNIGTLSEDTYESYAQKGTRASPMKALVGNALSAGAASDQEHFESAQSGESYEGLPAKIEIPLNGANTHFNLSMLDANKDLKMTSFFVKSYFFMFIDMLLVLGLGWILYRNRKTLKDALLKSSY